MTGGGLGGLGAGLFFVFFLMLFGVLFEGWGGVLV